VPLSHANLAISAGNVARSYQLSSSDVSLCVMPLFHVHGLVASTLATLSTGGTVVVPTKFSPLSFWQTAKEHGATWYSAVPTIHQLLLARVKKDSPRPAGAEKLRFIRSCSASLPPQVMHDLEAAFGAPVLEAYGMTEASHQMSSNPLPPGARKPGSVGIATGTEIKVVDAQGRNVPVGEVAIKGPAVTPGYLNNEEANAASFFDGWFRTGDRGSFDEDGYLRLEGRLKEMILRGGENISPYEIEEVLLGHPAVADAICFGIDDEKYGERVGAAVALSGDADDRELIAHCRERLSAFKVPEVVYVLEAIPRTPTGKVQRKRVGDSLSRGAA
jgi:acyl-CoA synthetase (AMP-forming)/AMP-acid ligase II